MWIMWANLAKLEKGQEYLALVAAAAPSPTFPKNGSQTSQVGSLLKFRRHSVLLEIIWDPCIEQNSKDLKSIEWYCWFSDVTALRPCRRCLPGVLLRQWGGYFGQSETNDGRISTTLLLSPIQVQSAEKSENCEILYMAKSIWKGHPSV